MVIHLFVLFVDEHAGDGDAVSPVLHRGHGGVEEHGGCYDDNDVLRETRNAHDHARGVTNKQEDDGQGIYRLSKKCYNDETSHMRRLVLPDHKEDGEVEREGNSGVEKENRAEGAIQTLKWEGLELPQDKAKSDEKGRGGRQIVEHAERV